MPPDPKQEWLAAARTAMEIEAASLLARPPAWMAN